MKFAESSPYGKKTLWEKEKLHVMSNFSFSHSVFERFVLQTRKNQGMFGKGLTHCEMWRLHFQSGPYENSSEFQVYTYLV